MQPSVTPRPAAPAPPVPAFERCIFEAGPAWFVMENSPYAPIPAVPGYVVRDVVVNNRWFGEAQQRKRRISFGTKSGKALVFDVAVFESPQWERAVLASEGKAGRNPKPGPVGTNGPNRKPRRARARAAELQGFPGWAFAEAPFTVSGAYELLGNAVPVPMARAIARAVQRAMYPDGQQEPTA